MENLLSAFAKRFSQPIILSFVIAWIVWNWEIVIALIWYNQETIKKLGVDNYVQYIELHKNIFANYIIPVCIAFAYPIVILIANNFTAFIRKFDQKLFFFISKDANVPTKFLLDAQDDIDSKEKRISKFISKEAEMLGNINELEINNGKLLGDLNLISEELNQLKLIHSSTNEKLYDEKFRADEYLRKSKSSYIIGNFQASIYQKSGVVSLSSLAEGNLKFELKGNNKLRGSLNIKFAEITSDVTYYNFDLENNRFLIYLKLVNVEKNNISENQNHILSTIIRSLMNSTLIFNSASGSNDYYKAESEDNNYRIDIERINTN
ncbi:hypothetical protein ACR79T_12620 [Sphingobacterium spiritivorum]|uniref:hypothetical protein n=1 Tax=Sphingobacterium spiritivorum TaxID=258 RepID=UPI003DA4452F